MSFMDWVHRAVGGEEPFIPPDPDEPIPSAPGATDAGLDGVPVDGPDEEPRALVAAVSGAPTWSQVYALAKKQIGTWPPGRVRENVNDYTQWYYGNNTSAAFCFIFISWVLAHAGASQSAGLALIGGKKAYVPYIRNIAGYHSGHSGMRAGAIVAVNGFEHIGFCASVGSGTFSLLSGNSTSGSSDDAITVKRYSLSTANGYVNLAYGSTPEEDDVPQYVSVSKTSKSRKETLVSGDWHQVYFDHNNSADAKHHHASGDFPSLVNGSSYYNGFVSLRLKGVPPGASCQARIVEVHESGGKYKDVKHDEPVEFPGTGGDTYVHVPAVGYVAKGDKIRVEVAYYGDKTVKPEVIGGEVRLSVWEV